MACLVPPPPPPPAGALPACLWAEGIMERAQLQAQADQEGGLWLHILLGTLPRR